MKQKLQVGDTAPIFNTVDIFGKPVSLQANTANAVLVVFLRYSGCPWCNLALHRLTVEYKLLKQNNCDVIAFIQSTPQNIQENIYDRHAQKPPFSTIADHKRKIYDLYKVADSVMAAARSITKIPFWIHSVREHGYAQTKIDGDVFLVPAMFLVSSRDGKILLASYGKSFYDHETFTQVYEQLGMIN